MRSELLLWVFKFGRILRVFKLLKFIDEARVLGQALQGCPSLRCLRRIACLEGLKGSGSGVLLGFLAGAPLGLRQLPVLEAHPAAEAFGVTMLLAAFLGGVVGQSQPLALAPLLQGCLPPN